IRFVDGGKRLVTGSQDGTIRRWDAVTGKEIESLGDRDGLTSHVALDRDAHTVAVARHGLSIFLLDPRTGEARRRCDGHERPVDALVLSDNGELLASSDRDGNLRLWETATGKQRPCLPGAEGGGLLSLSRDGRLVAACLRGQRLG